MKTTDELACELADRETLRDLAARYCDYGGRYFQGGGLRGCRRCAWPHELKKVYAKAIAKLDTRRFALNHVIDPIGENRATDRRYVEVYSANPGMERVGFGYDYEYVKVGDKWKFAGRRYFLDVIDTGVSQRGTFIA